MSGTTDVELPPPDVQPVPLDALHGVRDLVDLLGIPFSDEQLAAITAPLEPGVIVAGAGSGKTTVMAARVVWLVGTGQVLPGQVLGLTFTNKAAAELAGGVRSRLQVLASRVGRPTLLEESGEPTVSTYHAYAGSLLVEHGLRLGFEPDLRLVSDATRYQLAARAVTSFEGVREHLSISLPTLISQVIALDNQLSDHLVSIEDVRAFDADLRRRLADERQIREVLDAVGASHTRDELLDLVERYRDAKADARVLEFADSMARGALLAERCPEVGTAERARFRLVLLDEYQDTSVAQRRMLQGLFAAGTSTAGAGHPVTAVGDPCQAIYGWRGASVDNIDAFSRHFPQVDGTKAVRYALSVNRRCAVRVLTAANELAEPLYATHAGVRPLAAPEGAADGRLRVRLHETVVDEVVAVVDDVERLGQAWAADGGFPTWSDMAVLVRDGNERAALAGGLRARGIPVEVVGLTGLLAQPEVADVLATLRCVSSLTANAALLRLLAGPRWRVGPRDLALLGGRARRLAAADRVEQATLSDRLDDAVAGVDVTEVVSLSDALDDPGPLPYSEQARARFGALSAELTALRAFAGEPLVDLVRRVVDTLGLDVELASLPGQEAALARDNLALFVDAVAEFAGSDQTAGLYGLLAYLDAELEHNRGMAIADPGQDDSVKLLTVHTAKGLEWRAVFLPFLSEKVFPSDNPQPRWERTAALVPVPLRGDCDALPVQRSWSKADRDSYVADCRTHQEIEERRLAYVAVTRAKELVIASGHWWGRTQKTPRGPSRYLKTLIDHACPEEVRSVPAPADGAANPLVESQPTAPFPGRLDEPLLQRRREVAAEVRRELAAPPDSVDAAGAAGAAWDAGAAGTAGAAAQPVEAELAEIDAEIDALVAEARLGRTDEVSVDLPRSLSATTAIRLRTDPDQLAADLARPMPRQPSRAARFGSRFHAWVESRFGQQQLLDPEELPGRADSGIDDAADLRALVEAFLAGPYADVQPMAIEAPFQLVLAGTVVRGRIDAVYERPDGGFDVVDWKTSRRADADPTQLALYRLAWAELSGVPLRSVGAAFYYVRTASVVRPNDLPDREQLTEMLFGVAG